MSVGERLQWLLIVRRTTQTAVASEAGVSQSTVANLISNARKQPNAETLLGLARALRTSPEFLLFGAGDPLRTSLEIDDEESTLLLKFRGMSQRERMLLSSFMDIMLSPTRSPVER